MDIKQQATDQAVQHATSIVGSKLATGMTYGGGATAFIGGFVALGTGWQVAGATAAPADRRPGIAL